jgi:hypothetical protein
VVRGITILKERVAELRPLYQQPRPFQRTDYEPGELAQWDLWQPPVDIPVGFEVVQREGDITSGCNRPPASPAAAEPPVRYADLMGGNVTPSSYDQPSEGRRCDPPPGA